MRRCSLPQLAVDQAEKAQRIGVSYRDFLVGAAAIARTGSGLLVVHGANYKPEHTGETNLHAERVALHKIGRKVSEIAYLAIAGKPQPDQQSGCFLQLCTLADYVVTCCRAAISSPRKLLS